MTYRSLFLRVMFSFSACVCSWSGDAPVSVPPVVANVPVDSGYHFTVGTNQLYAYSLKQTVSWNSAGDALTYQSTLLWKFLLTVVEATPERAVLEATILRVQATHDGPGSRRLIDSGIKGEQNGAEDPLLGHLLALNGAVLTLVMNPTTGQVSEVRGGEAIVAKINKRAPAIVPGDPPPLDAAAKAAFSGEALGRIWNQLLAQPRDTPVKVPLGPPLNGEAERHWQGAQFTMLLPTGTNHLDATLVGDPTPVAVKLSALTGKGGVNVNLKNGMPGGSKGELGFLLTFNALTQPVEQRHQIVWELVPLISER
jgi:hypothetical protein